MARINTPGVGRAGGLDLLGPVQKTSEPIDRAQEIPLSNRHAPMTQNVVCCRYKEEKIRQGELLQVIVAL